MMHKTNDTSYAEDESVQVFELPYKGDEVSMVILLPKQKDRLAEIEKALTHKSLQGYLHALEIKKVVVCLPRFTMTCEFSLNEQLRLLGMVDAFDPMRVDFTRMSQTKGKELYISAVVHKAFVDVNEEGTEAAAATAVAQHASMSEQILFCADHPFLFFIRHKATDSILFMGRLADPS